MNAELLLEGFNLLGDGPQTIQQFRKLVVGLAVAGKLTSEKEDPDPSFLIKQIEQRTHALVQNGIIRKQNPTPKVTMEDLPKCFTNPDQFVQLGSIARIEKGPTGIMKAQPGPYPLVVTAEERSSCDHFDFDGVAAIVPLVSSAGHGKASLQRLHFQEGKFALGSILAAIFPHAPDLISARFLFEYLTAFKDELLVSRMIGTANVSLSVGKVSEVPVPLIAPCAQHKVDELMALCDRLEAASLARLNAPDTDTFQDDARFALNNLPALTTRPAQIQQLRQTILNLAVRGKLVPQDPSDEPASELLKQIAAEILVKKADETKHEALPFDVPKGWIWTHLGRLVAHSDAGWSPKTENHPRSGDNWGVLKVSAVSWDKFRALENKQVLPGTVPRIQVQVKRGDFLISRANTAELIARAVIVDEEPVKLMMSDKVVRLRLSENCDHRFVWIVNNYADFSREHYIRHASGVSPSMKNVSRDVIMTLPFPLPPLAEQNRIVAKVDELMALCDRLETSLTIGDDTRRRLLDAILAGALAPVEIQEQAA